MHVGQAVVTACVSVSESLVVQAHQVQDRRVKVVDVDQILSEESPLAQSESIRKQPTIDWRDGLPVIEALP